MSKFCFDNGKNLFETYDKNETDAAIEVIDNQVDELKETVLGEPNFDEGYYINADDTLTADENYNVSEYIPIDAGGVEFFYGTYNAKIKLLAYNSSKTKLDYWSGASGAQSRVITLPANTAYVRFAFNKGYIGKLIRGSVLKWEVEYEGGLDDEISVIENGLKQAKSVVGQECVTVKPSGVISAGTPIEITDFPYYLKKGQAYSFFCVISSFSSLKIGQGYQTNYGKWIEIDSTNVVVKQYLNDTETTVGTIAHGLTITDQLSVSMYIGNDGKGKCVITTLVGTFTHDFNMGYQVHGKFFAIGGQGMGNVVFNVTSTELRKPLWIFGDSYLGVFDIRVAGQLKNFGYFDNIMIHALSGINSADSYTEFEKAVALGATPKFLLWATGMNDSSVSDYETTMNKVKSFCEDNNVTLILYRVPTVPSRKTICEGINTIVMATGLRYINAYRAVDTDSDGNWAAGTLASDGIHPTETGAQLIANRYLIDAPEIMEY